MIQTQPLPYDKNTLVPTLSKKTFDYHYNKHYLGYVNELNTLIKGTKYHNMYFTNIILDSHKNNDSSIYNNAAQIWNHDFYWKSIDKLQKCLPKLIKL